MTCWFTHDWGWPRRRGERDVQVCLRCGAERHSKVQFGGPRYRLTQEAKPEAALPAFQPAPLVLAEAAAWPSAA
jgi:hypothetical protein